jgi:multicomponent Na+:H+ antiporter subunit G
MMIEWLINALALAGAFFVFVAGLGTWRLPDIYLRIHAATKASSLGVGLLLLGIILMEPTLGVIIKSVLMIFFVFLTAPVAAHMISRAAYLHHTPIWDRTKRDELKDKYAADHSRLDS